MKATSLFFVTGALLSLVACEPRQMPNAEPPPSTLANPPATVVPPSPAPSAVPVATAPAATPTTPKTAAPETPSLHPWAGTWSSPSCGGRKYERRITLASNNTFDAQDLVSPCPPNAKCVWSGIVNRKGTYKGDGASVDLAPDGPQGKQGVAFETHLVWDNAKAAPSETGDGLTCVYVRIP